jgi:arylsulfatase A-like enzyme
MAPKQPNFLVIVADDLGYSDLSSFGSEIQTPNIDSLSNAPSGLRFTSYHVAAACSPTRSMIMTGTDHHLTGLGQLSEYVRASPPHQGAPGHEGYLTNKVVALPELLKEGGYHTLMAGKWHLGLKKEYSPQARGFERSFALLPGCANHYGFEPQYSDPENEPPRFFETAVTALHMEDGEYVKNLPEDFYSSDFYGDKLVQYLKEHQEKHQEKPFFAYLPFSAPHWPLQAPKEVMDKYKGVYDDGPDALRLKRLQRLKDLGMVDPAVKPHEIVAVEGEEKPWDQLTADERAMSSRSMEAYAGMVERLDWNVGKVLDYLKETGQYENTLIYFMSDNGAEGASYEAAPIVGDEILKHIDKYYNNSIDNIGRKDSFVWYGTRWAQAGTAPSRLYKMFSTQGGCRVPLVVKPIKHGNSSEGGKIADAFCTAMDLVPTMLEYSGLKHPGTTYKGRQVEPVRGKSWKPFLDAALAKSPGKSPFEIHGEDRAFGFEMCGSGGLHKGRFKITYVPFPKGPQKWELFDIINDPGETTDISQEKPEVFNELLQHWAQYVQEVGVVGLAGDLPHGDIGGHTQAVKDEFTDTGRWIRFIGKDDVPERFRTEVPT